MPSITSVMPPTDGTAARVTGQHRASSATDPDAVPAGPGAPCPIPQRRDRGVLLFARDGSLQSGNAAAGHLLGRSLEQLRSAVGRGRCCVHPDGALGPHGPTAVCCLRSAGARLDGPSLVRVRVDGRDRWLSISSESLHRSGDGPAGQTLTTLLGAPEVAGLASGADAPAPGEVATLGTAVREFERTQHKAPVGVTLLSTDGRMVRVNPALARMAGDSVRALQDTRLLDLVHPEDRTRAAGLFVDVLQGADPGPLPLRLQHARRQPLYVRLSAYAVRDGTSEPVCLVSHVEDVTGRTLAEQALNHQSTHDALTALPNRKLVLERLQEALQRCGSEPQVALLFCGIDRFKRINDSLGHDAGDLLLVELAQRLRQQMRATDTAGRLGGDEFVVVCDEVADRAEALVIADRIRALAARRFCLRGQPVSITVSIGVAFGGRDDAPEGLLREADAAMNEAKAQGRSRVQVFDDTLRGRARQRLQLEGDLRQAPAAGQLRLYHQPIVALESRRVVGHEALVRWAHPTRGLLGPEAFLEIAEESDLIVEVGSWVLGEAVRQAAQRRRAHQPGRVAVNMSARQLTGNGLRAQVERTLADGGLPARHLTIELTETSLLRASARTLADLTALTRSGVRLAIDDFGTGYSSLTYLQKLPVGEVKIDRSFVADIDRDARRTAIVKAVIALGTALALDVVAEGVETEQQARVLSDLGCRYAQGFLFGRPEPQAQP